MKNCMVLFVAGIVAAAFAVSRAEDKPKPPPAKPNAFVGAKGCTPCHDAKSKGNQYATWMASKHAAAWRTLATPAAIAIGKEKGIADPQKDNACLKCHVTAFGEPAARLAKSFDPTQGIQCESCHGPGEFHRKERNLNAADFAEDEIIAAPDVKTCERCHNKESPAFKPFCFKGFVEKIRHLDLRKERTKEEVEAMKCDNKCGIEHPK
ncbi:MAG: hypothetical protein HYY18_09880 [Planctomycetes bacterium]|nr:hypothetical protein [Planctomycetota bacterium]